MAFGRLDFDARKTEITAADGARRARGISSFAYSTFGEALNSACARWGASRSGQPRIHELDWPADVRGALRL
jgi:hypothetical protein